MNEYLLSSDKYFIQKNVCKRIEIISQVKKEHQTYTLTKGLKFSLRIDSIIKKSFERINMIFILKEKNPMFSFQKSKIKNQI
ncbi:hypothetical protein [Leptospira interrogans]|uniref:hypothetical protein n=1 Tax=Leptospira interrogans TaxID=173 RepID=UPI000774D87D|nr:hypothetical protein [Leptospira interrogans]